MYEGKHEVDYYSLDNRMYKVVGVVIVCKVAQLPQHAFHLVVRRRCVGYLARYAVHHHYVVGLPKASFISAIVESVGRYVSVYLENPFEREVVVPVFGKIVYRGIVVGNHLLTLVARFLFLPQHLFRHFACGRRSLHLARRYSLFHNGAYEIEVLVALGYYAVGAEVAAYVHVKLVHHGEHVFCNGEAERVASEAYLL